MFLFSFLVNFCNDLLIPVPIINTKVKEAPVIPVGILYLVLNVPIDTDKVVNIVSK